MSFCTHFPPFKHFSAHIPKIDYTLAEATTELRVTVAITYFFFKFVGRMLRLKQLGVRLASTSAASGTTKSRKLLDSVIRVDHAGELGADRIYAGQMAVLGINQIRL